MIVKRTTAGPANGCRSSLARGPMKHKSRSIKNYAQKRGAKGTKAVPVVSHVLHGSPYSRVFHYRHIYLSTVLMSPSLRLPRNAPLTTPTTPRRWLTVCPHEGVDRCYLGRGSGHRPHRAPYAQAAGHGDYRDVSATHTQGRCAMNCTW